MPAECSEDSSPIEGPIDSSESERVRILQELAVLESTNATLSAEVARLKEQVEAARGKIRSIWDYIFRLQAEKVAESARLKAELSSLSQRLPKLEAALIDLKCQNDALRLQNADWKKIARRLISRVWPCKKLFKF